jgi:Zn finger protein HypA/HybF involved in hydrogenase expression
VGIQEQESVRCLDCRHEYDLPQQGDLRCPECGSATWIAADIRETEQFDAVPVPT